MRSFLLIFLLVTFHDDLFSQAMISGKVTDKQTQEALRGATVTIKGGSTSVITDIEGNFLLKKVKPGKVIVLISYVGYENAETSVDITGDNSFIVNAFLNRDERMGNAVVVTASNHPEKNMNAPASISVFGVKDFDQFSGSNINEMVSKVNSVQYSRSGINWITFNARNFNSGGNNKVVQMVDGRLARAALSAGIPLFNMGSYIKDDVEKLEIVLGPHAALYGPNTLNALFNVITKDPRKYPGTTVALSAGNHNQFSGRLRHAEKINNKLAYKLNGEYAVGREYLFYDRVYIYPGSPVDSTYTPERNVDFDFRHIRGEGHVYYSLTPKADIIVSGGAGSSNLLQPGRVQIKNVIHGFLQARVVHPNYFVTISNTFGNIGDSYQVTPYTRSFWIYTHPPNSWLPDTAEAVALKNATGKERSQRLNADAQYNYSFQKIGLFFIGGLSYQNERPNGFGVNLLDSFQRIRITQYGATAQIEKSLPWKLRFMAAIRYDHHSNFGDYFSPKLGLMRIFGDNNFRFTWGRSYAMPSILIQYASIGKNFFGIGEGITYIPNNTHFNEENYKFIPPVNVEEVNSWEVGYKGLIAEKIYVDITYYNSVSDNFLGPARSVPGRIIYAGDQRVHSANPGFVDSTGVLRNASFACNFNYGRVRNDGLDVDINYSFNKFINLVLKYSWFGSDITDQDMKNDANNNGYVSLEETSLNAPKHKGIIRINMQHLLKNKMFVNISTRLVQQYDFYSGSQIGTKAGEGYRGRVYEGIGPNGQPRYSYKNFDWGPLGGFITIDLSAGYKINQLMQVNMSITNLFNTEQMEFVGSPSIGRLIMFELKVHVPKGVK